ncbi:MAG: membrane protein insertase YidC [Gammaproteobacteria bacterium]
MDNQRPILYLALAFLLFFIWQTWQTDHLQKQAPAKASTEQTTAAPATPAAKPGEVPGPSTADMPPADETTPAKPKPATASVPAEGQIIHVRTDLLDVEISTRGGTLIKAQLPTYPVSVEQPDVPFVVLHEAGRAYVAQSGLISDQGKGNGLTVPNHHAVFQAQKLNYELAPGQNELRVPLTWRNADGMVVTKTYIFERDKFLIKLDTQVHNGSGRTWSGRQYRQLRHGEVVTHHSFTQPHTYSFTGAAYYEDGRYEKLAFDKMQENPLDKTLTGGWIAMLQHYFLSAWVPAQDAKEKYYTRVLGKGDDAQYMIGLLSPSHTVAPGQNAVFKAELYVGPKVQKRLEAIAPGLELTNDYGIFTFLAKPIFWLMVHIHKIVGNWGWSIILLTVLIKLAFFKLSATSYRSMARMRAMQPKIAAIKERLGDDRSALGQATMELYKKEKINPLGGCLPIVVQIPVFIALYWVLLESVELRQAPFMFWINDLSVKDPYYVLPVIMGVTMFLQQRLNPPQIDPMQQKIMMIMPVAFTFFFAFFPSGLVLYWLTNNILSIAQQWVITRKIERDMELKRR